MNFEEREKDCMKRYRQTCVLPCQVILCHLKMWPLDLTSPELWARKYILSLQNWAISDVLLYEKSTNMLIIREMQTKAQYHLIPIRLVLTKRWKAINIDESVDKRKPTYFVDYATNWYSHFGKYESSSVKLKLELSHDVTISITGINPKKLKSVCCRNLCTSMFISAAFTTAMIWKQLRCSWLHLQTQQLVKPILLHTHEHPLLGANTTVNTHQ